MFHVPNDYRLKTGVFRTSPGDGNNGCFILPPLIGRRYFFVIASDEIGWEHVSIHMEEGKRTRTPTWDEMNHIKNIFWDEIDTVIQYHPSKTDYVNTHPHTLHLWRPTEMLIPVPPLELV